MLLPDCANGIRPKAKSPSPRPILPCRPQAGGYQTAPAGCDRISARDKLSKSEKKLSGIIYERGVDDRGFALIRSKGDQALFGGYSTHEMKKKLAIPGGRPLADFLPR